MFGIKLVSDIHFDFPYFKDDFGGTDGKWTLMNFSNRGNVPAIARNIPNGHRSIVYQTYPIQRFTRVIEYIGQQEGQAAIEQGKKAAIAHGIHPREVGDKWAEIYRCIRFLAKFNDWREAPELDDVLRLTGFPFPRAGFGMKYITKKQYDALFNAIHWSWTKAGAD